MNFGDMVTEVGILVDDDELTEEMIGGYINQALLDVAGQVFLPSLKRVTTVTTSLTNSYVSLAALTGGFGGRLVKVINADGTSLGVVASLEVLVETYGLLTTAGSVETVCLEGNVLWYAYLPAVAETLTVLYYSNPAELFSDDDTPSDIPEFCHRQLLVNGAAALAFADFEDGLDGEKVNTMSHLGLQENGFKKLREWLGRNRLHCISSMWSN